MKDFQFLKPVRRKIKTYEKSFLQFFIQKKQQLLLIAPFFVFSLLLLTLLSLDKATLQRIDSIVLVSSPVKFTQEYFYPRIPSVLGEQATQSTSKKNTMTLSALTAKGIVVMDDESKVVLFSKNPQLRFSMASTTKIMTALTALEYFHPSDILTIKENYREGTIIGLTKGEHMSFENLLYAMLLPSGNDAAIAIAQNFPGGIEAFVSKMNENAKRFYLTGTHFSDPDGLIDEGDYTTVIDLARLASLAIENPILNSIVATKNIVISNAEGTKTYSLYNLNKLLGVNGVVGIKTGFTQEAGGILVTEKTEQNHRLIIVVMKSEDRFLDTSLLLSFLTENIIYTKLE